VAHTMDPFDRFLCVLTIGAFIACILGTPVDAQDTRRIDVFSGRALSHALLILERELDCAITYEDPLWEAPLVEEMFEGGPVVPKKTSLSLEYSLGSPEIVIQEVLNQYHQQTDRASFELTAGPEGIYNVVPVKCKNAAGELVENHSVLDAKISLSMQDATFSEIMNEIISKLPQKLALARVFVQHYATMSVSWDNKDARSCINQVFYELNKVSEHTFSWHIRRGPASESRPAVFNVHTVRARQQWHTRIEAARPLAEALKILERNFRDTITYEDALYLRRFDVMRNRDKEPQKPRGGIIDFSYSPDMPSYRAIQNCLADYNHDRDNPAVFTIEYEEEEPVIHVFPILLRDMRGEIPDEEHFLVPHTPILSTVISVSEQDKSPLDILRAICGKVAESSGAVINMGEFPQERLSVSPVSFSVADRPARVALTGFLKSISRYLSWQLLYDPKSKEYILNIHDIKAE
jgi:hypothetical protein